MMHSSWWETGFIVIYEQKQRPRWQEALLQAQQETDLEFGNETEPGLSPDLSLHTNITALDETSPQQKSTTELPLAWKLLINKHKLWLVQPNHLALHSILVH